MLLTIVGAELLGWRLRQVGAKPCASAECPRLSFPFWELEAMKARDSHEAPGPVGNLKARALEPWSMDSKKVKWKPGKNQKTDLKHA